MTGKMPVATKSFSFSVIAFENRYKCFNHAGVTSGKYVNEHYCFAGYGCGLCPTSVPCE
jgi:hypothetical protein